MAVPPFTPEELQEIAQRDQLWASLRVLSEDIAGLAEGRWEDSPRERQVVQILAKVVAAELKFRAEHPAPE